MTRQRAKLRAIRCPVRSVRGEFEAILGEIRADLGVGGRGRERFPSGFAWNRWLHLLSAGIGARTAHFSCGRSVLFLSRSGAAFYSGQQQPARSPSQSEIHRAGLRRSGSLPLHASAGVRPSRCWWGRRWLYQARIRARSSVPTASGPVLASLCRITSLTVRKSRSMRPFCQGAKGSPRRQLLLCSDDN